MKIFTEDQLKIMADELQENYMKAPVERAKELRVILVKIHDEIGVMDFNDIDNRKDLK